MAVNDLQSNMADGYAIFQLMSVALRRRWDHQPTVLDVGRSLGIGLKKWFGPGFRPIITYQKLGKDDPIAPETLIIDEAAQNAVIELAGHEPAVGTVVGYDYAVPYLDPEDPDLAKREPIRRLISHTFPMGETVRRPRELKEFVRLARTMPPNLIFPKKIIHAEDAESLAAITEYLPNGKTDIAIFSAVLFQHPPEVVNKILENHRPYFNEGGLIFVSDFAFANQRAPNGFQFVREDWWHRPASFATFVLDPFRPNMPPVEIARFLSRRGIEMWLSDAGRELLLNGELPN
jgi:hypothetical protein